MSVNATLVGQVLALFILIPIFILAPVSYYLGKRKTETPEHWCEWPLGSDVSI